MGYPYSHDKEVPILSKYFGDPEARTLEGWRHDGSGPRFVRCSRRCIRYRIKDLEAWQESRLAENTIEVTL